MSEYDQGFNLFKDNLHFVTSTQGVDAAGGAGNGVGAFTSEEAAAFEATFVGALHDIYRNSATKGGHTIMKGMKGGHTPLLIAPKTKFIRPLAQKNKTCTNSSG